MVPNHLLFDVVYAVVGKLKNIFDNDDNIIYVQKKPDSLSTRKGTFCSWLSPCICRSVALP